MAAGGAIAGGGIAYATGGNALNGAWVGLNVSTRLGALSPRAAAAAVSGAGRAAAAGGRAVARGASLAGREFSAAFRGMDEVLAMPGGMGMVGLYWFSLNWRASVRAKPLWPSGRAF
jgi:hypothetical protein